MNPCYLLNWLWIVFAGLRDDRDDARHVTVVGHRPPGRATVTRNHAVPRVAARLVWRKGEGRHARLSVLRRSLEDLVDVPAPFATNGP